MITIAAIRMNDETSEWFVPAQPFPENATSIVFNGSEYVVYEGEEATGEE